MGLGLSGMHQQVGAILVHAYRPGEHPRWLGPTLIATGLGAAAADFLIGRHLTRPMPPDETPDLLRQLYREEAERIAAGRAAGSPAPALPAASSISRTVTETATLATAATPVPASRYLTDEGAEDVTGVEEGCLACAKGHFGAHQGMLERGAQAAAAEGRCGRECQEWVAGAAREMVALTAHDWTPERIARTPPEQQQVILRYQPAVAEMESVLLGGEEQRAIVEAATTLTEATRFTDSGDPLDHPAVRRRTDYAERALLAGERRRMAALPPPVRKEVREIRQTLLNRVDTPEHLHDVAVRAEDLAAKIQSEQAAAWTPDQVRALAERAKEIRTAFRADVEALGIIGRPAPGAA